MAERTLEEQLTKYLTDVHSIEVQALAQLEAAPDVAGDERLAAPFREHLEETREQERLVRDQLVERGADTSTLKGRARDQAVVDLAQRIAAQERAMAERLARSFDQAVEASLREKDAESIGSELVSYLSDAHAIEAQALQLLQAGPRIVGFEALADIFRDHLVETGEQQRLVADRLRAHDARPSRLQDTAMRIGGLNIGAFFAAQPDTPPKLAGFAFAFEHLEIAAYELLRRIAERAGDSETVATADRILVEERRTAGRIAETWDAAMDAALVERVAP